MRLVEQVIYDLWVQAWSDAVDITTDDPRYRQACEMTRWLVYVPLSGGSAA